MVTQIPRTDRPPRRPLADPSARHRAQPLINWWEVAFKLWVGFGMVGLLYVWTQILAGQLGRDWGYIAVIVWAVSLLVFAARAERNYAPPE